MRVGDKVQRKNYDGVATIIQMEVQHQWDDVKQRDVVKTQYVARYDDTGHLLRFNGYNIGKTIFKWDPNEQLSFLNDI